MRNRIFVGLALAVCLLGLAREGQSQPGEGWGRDAWGGQHERMGTRLMAMLESDRFKTALSLTDQQTDRLRQIMVDAQKATVKAGAEIAVKRIELRELLRADKPDRDAVMRKVQEVASLRGEMMKQHVDALLAAKSVLTPEQQRKIRSFIEGRRDHARMRERSWERLERDPGRPGGPPEPAPNAPEPPVE